MFEACTEWYALPDSVRPPTACTYTVHAAWSSWSSFHPLGVAMYVYWSPTLPPVGAVQPSLLFFFRRQLRFGYIPGDFFNLPYKCFIRFTFKCNNFHNKLNFKCLLQKNNNKRQRMGYYTCTTPWFFRFSGKGGGTASHKRRYRGGRQGCRTDAASARCKGQTYPYI